MGTFWVLTALIITSLVASWLAISLMAAFLLYLFAVLSALAALVGAVAQTIFKFSQYIRRNIKRFFGSKS